MSKREAFVFATEFVLMIAGIALLAVYAFATTYGQVVCRLSVRDFDSVHGGLARVQTAPAAAKWSAFKAAAPPVPVEKQAGTVAGKTTRGSVLAVVRLVKLNIRIPVFDGITPTLLNQGAGWIAGTGRLGEAGNAGIAGHRDRFFRCLKDFKAGDLIELSTAMGTTTYIVDEIEIVDPKNVAVLGPRSAPSLTFVTCYPFYFVGSAPKRFVLHARLASRSGAE